MLSIIFSVRSVVLFFYNIGLVGEKRPCWHCWSDESMSLLGKYGNRLCSPPSCMDSWIHWNGFRCFCCHSGLYIWTASINCRELKAAVTSVPPKDLSWTSCFSNRALISTWWISILKVSFYNDVCQLVQLRLLWLQNQSYCCGLQLWSRCYIKSVLHLLSTSSTLPFLHLRASNHITFDHSLQHFIHRALPWI